MTQLSFLVGLYFRRSTPRSTPDSHTNIIRLIERRVGRSAFVRRPLMRTSVRHPRGRRLAELDISHPDLQLDKTVGEGGRLSGGQQQRVNLARAMLKRGTIYLLDEPTTGLDNAVARSLQKTLDKLAENATTICITHHLGDLKTSDDVIYLDVPGHRRARFGQKNSWPRKARFYQQVNARGRTRAQPVPRARAHRRSLRRAPRRAFTTRLLLAEVLVVALVVAATPA